MSNPTTADLTAALAAELAAIAALEDEIESLRCKREALSYRRNMIQAAADALEGEMAPMEDQHLDAYWEGAMGGWGYED